MGGVALAALFPITVTSPWVIFAVECGVIFIGAVVTFGGEGLFWHTVKWLILKIVRWFV